MKSSPLIHYLIKQVDVLSISSNLAKLAFLHSSEPLHIQQHILLAAIKLLHPALQSFSLNQIQEVLQALDEQQFVDWVSKLKAMLYEMQCLRLSNAEGDQIYAFYLKPLDIHSTRTVLITDIDTAESFNIQLQTENFKQTPALFKFDRDAYSPANVMNQHAENPLILAQELQQKIQHQSEDLNNKSLSQSVETAMDLWINAKDPHDQDFWAYFPVVSVASVSLAIFDLYQRYQNQEISWSEFKWMSAKISGLKLSKIALIGLLLGLPVVGQVTGVYLVAKLLLDAKATWFEKDSPLYLKLKQHWTRSSSDRS